MAGVAPHLRGLSLRRRHSSSSCSCCSSSSRRHRKRPRNEHEADDACGFRERYHHHDDHERRTATTTAATALHFRTLERRNMHRTLPRRRGIQHHDAPPVLRRAAAAVAIGWATSPMMTLAAASAAATAASGAYSTSSSHYSGGGMTNSTSFTAAASATNATVHHRHLFFFGSSSATTTPLLLQYVGSLALLLTAWVLYLLLPRGVRVQFCRGHPRRYARRKSTAFVGGRWVKPSPVDGFFAGVENGEGASSASVANSVSVVGGIVEGSDAVYRGRGGVGRATFSERSAVDIERQRRLRLQRDAQASAAAAASLPSFAPSSPPDRYGTELDDAPSTPSRPAAGAALPPPSHQRPPRQWQNLGVEAVSTMAPSFRSPHALVALSRRPTAPSPVHPDRSNAHVPPADIIISRTLSTLRDEPGVRLWAHGTQCKPRRLWLRLKSRCVTWQTESRRKNKGAPPKGDGVDDYDGEGNGSPPSGQVVVRGPLHEVPLTDVLYVDVGKQTTALRRIENATIPEGVCFSLLTKDGSLDLQATSVLQRDALVSCFSLVLDEVHADDWRRLYHEASGGGSGISGSRGGASDVGTTTETSTSDGVVPSSSIGDEAFADADARGKLMYL